VRVSEFRDSSSLGSPLRSARACQSLGFSLVSAFGLTVQRWGELTTTYNYLQLHDLQLLTTTRLTTTYNYTTYNYLQLHDLQLLTPAYNDLQLQELCKCQKKPSIHTACVKRNLVSPQVLFCLYSRSLLR
jgi:hypothetical protein